MKSINGFKISVIARQVQNSTKMPWLRNSKRFLWASAWWRAAITGLNFGECRLMSALTPELTKAPRMILFFLGTMIMACFGIQSAIGQTSPQQPDSSADRKAACELIDASLQKSFQEKDTTEQIAESQKTSNQILKLCKTNLAVTQILKEAISNAADVSDKQQAAKLMQDALREAGATLAFKPLIEAPLPEGFPEPTPVGEIQIKKYPAYRLARTQMAGAESGAFLALFMHIKKQDIAMTAPVEMTYGEAGKNKLQAEKMAFLYRSTKQGKAGTDEKVEVIDVPATMALSLGMRGDVTKARLAEAKAHLDIWLKEHIKEYEANGQLRVMGYNSPFVAANKRFTEVEVAVRLVPPTR